MKPSAHLTELSAAQLRQYIDAEAVFSASEQAGKEAAEVRGSMFWRRQGANTYLIRTSAAGAQTSLGPRSEENLAIHRRFIERKQAAEERVKNLRSSLQQQQRLNRALRVGREPLIVIETLEAIAKAGLDTHFLVVGTQRIVCLRSRGRRDGGVRCDCDAGCGSAVRYAQALEFLEPA